MKNSIVLTLKELQQLIKNAEKFQVIKDELKQHENPDYVTLHIVRLGNGELAIKVIH